MAKPQSAPAAPAREIVLQLGDLLHRIPKEYLLPGPHDSKQPVRFTVDELADFIGTGKSTMSVERLSRACPDVFKPDAPRNADVPFPFQKVMGLMPHRDAPEPRQRLLFPAARAEGGPPPIPPVAPFNGVPACWKALGRL